LALAERIFAEMKEVPQNPKPDLITFSTMIKGYCKGRQIEKALSLLQDMEKAQIKPDEVLYNSLLDGCCKSDQV
jgi:pentatricopeptide repeat protein